MQMPVSANTGSLILPPSDDPLSIEETDAPDIIPFDQDIQVGIYENLQVNIAELLNKQPQDHLTNFQAFSLVYQNPGKRLAMSLFAGILITTD